MRQRIYLFNKNFRFTHNKNTRFIHRRAYRSDIHILKHLSIFNISFEVFMLLKCVINRLIHDMDTRSRVPSHYEVLFVCWLGGTARKSAAIKRPQKPVCR